MKRNFIIELTPAQFKKLHLGLHTQFRFFLNLAFETVTYNTNAGVLTVHLPIYGEHQRSQISNYIFGFAQAIQS